MNNELIGGSGVPAHAGVRALHHHVRIRDDRAIQQSKGNWKLVLVLILDGNSQHDAHS